MTSIRIFTLSLGIATFLFGWKLDSFFATPGTEFLNQVFMAAGAALAAMTLLPPAWLVRLHVIAFSIGIPILLFDLAAQALTPRWEPVVVDERLLSKTNPGCVTSYAVRDGEAAKIVEVRINSNGYRGPELEPSPRRRIVVYGDSFIYGAATAEENTFPARLKKNLETATGQNLEVVNAGVTGYGPDQILLRMQDELPQLQASVVVTSVFCGNDYGDLVRNRLFELDGEGRPARAPTQLDEELNRLARLPRFRSFLLHQLSKLRSGFALDDQYSPPQDESGKPARNTVWVEKLLERRRQEYEKAVVQKDYVVSRRELVDDFPDADIAFTPRSDSARYKTALMQQILLEIEAAVSSSGGQLVVLLIPDPDHLIENYDGHVIDREAWPEFDPTIATGQLADFLEARGVPVLDLFPVYAASEPQRLYLELGDNHWNDAGQAAAAEAFSSFLIERGLYP